MILGRIELTICLDGTSSRAAVERVRTRRQYVGLLPPGTYTVRRVYEGNTVETSFSVFSERDRVVELRFD